MNRWSLTGLTCFSLFLGLTIAHSGLARLIPVKVVHGQTAGPLDGGDLVRIDFPVAVGKPFAEGNLIISNTSKHDARVVTVRPERLTQGLRLVALRAWLVPRSAHLMLPGGSRDWPLKDPRARSAKPARNVTIPAHRWVQLIFALEATHAGVSQLDGVRITFNAGGRDYDWTLGHTIVVHAKRPRR